MAIYQHFTASLIVLFIPIRIAVFAGGDVKMALCIGFRPRFLPVFGAAAGKGPISLKTEAKLVDRESDIDVERRDIDASLVVTSSLVAISGTSEKTMRTLILVSKVRFNSNALSIGFNSHNKIIVIKMSRSYREMPVSALKLLFWRRHDLKFKKNID